MKKLAWISALITLPALAATERQVSVSGVCNRMVTPDRGSIVLTVEYVEPNLPDATEKAARAYEQVLAATKRLGLADFNQRTVEYTVGEKRDWENSKNVFKGYQARMGLWVSTSEIKKLGEVIAVASREKVKNVGSLQTYLSEEKQLSEQLACLKDAAANAEAKAQKLAQALGAKLGDVISMIESGAHAPPGPRPEVMMMADSAFSAKSAAPSIEAGQQNLALTINVTFGLKN